MQAHPTRTGFDPRLLKRFCLGDPQLETEIAQVFIDDARWLQARLAGGRISRDELQLLIGRCDLVGATEVADLARRHCRADSPPPSTLDVAQVSQAFDILLEQFGKVAEVA